MIVCCGEAVIDFLPRISAEGASVYEPLNGGSIFNTSIAIGRLGLAAGFFGGISSDFFGDGLIAALKASGVSLKYTKVWDHPSTLAFVKLDQGHARYSFFDDNSAGRMLTRKDLPKLGPDVRALHFGSFSLTTEPSGSTYEALLTREAKRRVICLDPNIRVTLIKDRKRHLARLNRLIKRCDILKISDEDVEWMTGKRDLAAVARKWLRAGAKIVVITRGGDGVAGFTRRFSLTLPSVKVKVADTVGAGDTFTAGLLAAMSKAKLLDKASLAQISQDDLQTALSFAARAAAITVSRPGADPPWAREMEIGNPSS